MSLNIICSNFSFSLLAVLLETFQYLYVIPNHRLFEEKKGDFLHISLMNRSIKPEGRIFILVITAKNFQAMCFSRNYRYLLITGDEEGLVNILDTSIRDEDDALLSSYQVIGRKKSSSSLSQTNGCLENKK